MKKVKVNSVVALFAFGFEPVFVGDLTNAKDLELMGKYAMKIITK